MNVFKNEKIQKKLIITLVILILFCFCFPKNVNAGILFPSKADIQLWLTSVVYDGEYAILAILNNLFCDTTREMSLDADSSSKHTVYLTPETIIKGNFLLMDANIFKDFSSLNSSSTSYNTSTNGKEYYDDQADYNVNGKIQIQKTIRGWYTALRNLAIVALLSILVYVGIRMMMTSIATDKAKYKSMFMDWLVALCLVVLMHYIMVGVLNLSEMIVDAINPEGTNSTIVVKVMDGITDGLENDSNDSAKIKGARQAFGYEIVLFAIIAFTGIYAFKYMKRALVIMFLILLAPITCITYPLDKIGDGKAQAFNFWLREFMYNVLIQPFHLLLYIVLIGSSTKLASENIIYSILCYAMLLPAEKLIRQMFGFDKAKMGSPLGAMATGAAMNQLMKGAGNMLKGRKWRKKWNQ